MTKIKFGTDGWRAIIAEEYTTDNVARVSAATADWLNERFVNPSVVVGPGGFITIAYETQ